MKMKLAAQIQGMMMIGLCLSTCIWAVTWFLQASGILSADAVMIPYFAAIALPAFALALELGMMHFRDASPFGRLGCIAYWVVAAGRLLYDVLYGFSSYEPIAWIIGIAVAYVFFFRKKEEEMVAGIIAES